MAGNYERDKPRRYSTYKSKKESSFNEGGSALNLIHPSFPPPGDVQPAYKGSQSQSPGKTEPPYMPSPEQDFQNKSDVPTILDSQ